MKPEKLLDWFYALLVLALVIMALSLFQGCTVVRVNSRDCVPNIRFEFFAVTIESCDERAPAPKPTTEGATRAARAD